MNLSVLYKLIVVSPQCLVTMIILNDGVRRVHYVGGLGMVEPVHAQHLFSQDMQQFSLKQVAKECSHFLLDEFNIVSEFSHPLRAAAPR